MPKLYPHQREAVAWLAPRRTAALFDGMRVGKTAPTICAIPRGAPVVVVCPSGVKWNWHREFKSWRPEFRARVAQGRMGFRWPRPGLACMVNFEILPPAAREIELLRAKVARFAVKTDATGIAEHAKLARRLKRTETIRAKVATEPHRGTVLIVDEAQWIKNPDTHATKRFREMAARVVQRGGRVWVLTGSPLENERDELWTVLQAAGLGTEAFGDHNGYLAAWENPGEVPGRLRTVSLRRRLQDVVANLPPKAWETRTVPIGPALRAELDKIVKALRARGVVLATATLEQIKLAAGQTGIRDHVMRTREALAVAKVPAMLEMIAECEDAKVPLVVMCCHKRPLALIRNRRRCAVVTGDEDEREKEESIARFMRGDADVLGAGYKAGGVGRDYSRAWRMLEVDLPWNPATLDQGEARIENLKQRRALLYTRLVADHPLERRVEFLLSGKRSLIEQSVDASAVAPAGGAT